MLYSKSAQYAIQAMIHLAKNDASKPILIPEIADAYGIPQQFLAKIAQTLSKFRLVKTMRGRNGGVQLARPAEKIYIRQIVNAIDGPPPDQDECVVGLDYCSDTVPCPFHDNWKPIREEIKEMLESEHLGHLSKRVVEKQEQMRKD